MGGKSSTTTSGVSVPPQVLAQYQSVNQSAGQTAQTPFNSYVGTGTSVAPDYASGTAPPPVAAAPAPAPAATPSYGGYSTYIPGVGGINIPAYNAGTANGKLSTSAQPSVAPGSPGTSGNVANTGANTGTFVAPINAQQQAGIAGTNAYANEAQPFYSAATGQLQTAQGGADAYNAAATGTLNGAQAGTYGYNANAQGALSAAQNGVAGYNANAASTLQNAQNNTGGVNAAALYGTAASASPLTGQQINQYLSPYLNDVLGSESALLNQNNQQQQAGQLGNAITSGAFGGDRTGIAAANLEQQQNLANASIYSGILNSGYQSALSTAQGQQQLGLAGAAQLANIGNTAYGQGANTAAQMAALGQTQYSEGANTAAQEAALGQTQYNESANTAAQQAAIGQTAYGEGANTATGLAALGSGAQAAGLAGANAQISAGTVEQQTQQAQDTAQYNQFLQQQSYPFQVDQFLANIAEGTGALSGSTTTTTQPGGFFSDRDLKRDIKKIGKLHDGQDVVSYKMGDDKRTRIGLIAQDVEKRHPDAVGVAGGYKTVDYGKATEKAANQGHFYAGGVVPFRRKAYAYGGSPDGEGLAGVLAAQQQMYSGMAGGNNAQRVQNASGSGTHQLAVSNAPPTQAQSGISQVNQGINTVNNGYKLYRNMNPAAKPPPTTPSSGVAPASAPSAAPQPAGLQPSGVTTYPAPDPTATVAPTQAAAPVADTAAPAAADTAAPAAADVASTAAPAASEAAASAAAPAATDAVATGATTYAASTAAAEAAAALAAEYAAAEVGTAAVMMAKRGGSIKRALGGQVPYDESSLDANGNLNIPDNQNTTSLKAAPAAGKQPTGFQNLMYMGNPNNTSSLMGSMFSNQAAATGGVIGRRGKALRIGGVAGRRGFDDGGDVSETLDPVTVTAQAPTVDDDSQVTPVTADNTGVAAAAASDQPSDEPKGLAAGKKSQDPDSPNWWDRNKGNVIPILSAIGAMGTAKTKNWGTALAAGLAGGADSYVGTQEGLAKAADIQAQAQGRGLENQITAVRARAANDFYPPSGGVVPPAQDSASGTPTVSAPSAPVSAPTPTAAPRMGAPPPQGAAPALTGSTSQGVSPAAQTAANIDQSYRQKYFVQPGYTPDEQAAMQKAIKQSFALNSDAPVNAVKQQHDNRVQVQQTQNRNSAQAEADGLYAQATDPNADYSTSQAALAKYNAVHQWTGDEYTTVGGNKNNSRNGAPAIGVAAAQLTPEQLTQVMGQAQAMVDVPNSDGTTTQMPAWQAHRAPSPQAYAQQLTSLATSANQLRGAQSTSPTLAAPTVRAAPAAIARPAPARAAAPTPGGAPVPHPVARANDPATATVAQVSQKDPYLAKALSDPTWRIPAPPVTSGRTQSPQDLNKINKINDAGIQLSKDADAVTATSATSLQYLKAAKAIMDSKGANVGYYGGLIAGASQVMGGGPKSTNYQELAKYLGNAAAQTAKSNFPNATQQEMGMQFQEMSPNVKMNDDTINDLLRTNIRAAQYTIGSATRAKVYLDAGNNPLNFEKWNQQYYARDKIVNASKTGTGADGSKWYFVNGKWTQ